MNNFKKLIVWQKSIDFVEEIYKTTKLFPNEEKFGIVSQIQRASISISNNIAEGSGRNTTNDFKHFLAMANGSSFEVENLLIISNRLGYLEKNKTDELISKVDEIQKMIYSLKNKFENDLKS